MRWPGAYVAYLGFLLSRTFWFVPAALTVGALALAAGTLYLDEHLSALFEHAPAWLAPAGLDGSRAVLAAIASSMVTAASLVFSMTLLALSVASAQLGPRLLTTFMGDRQTQVALGAFIATFVYALVVLRTVGGGSGGVPRVPHLSVTVALIGALVSLGYLLQFIHHVAGSMRADTVIARVSHDLKTALAAQLCDDEPTDRSAADTRPADADDGAPVAADATGYVQVVDRDALVRLAADHDVEIRMLCRAGHFVIRGTPLARVSPAGRVERTELHSGVRACAVLGPTRTPMQDLEFCLRQLTEIALRALSPGVNDPHTAVACVDHLAGGFADTLRRPPTTGAARDAAGVTRVWLAPVTVPGMLDEAFDEIRQAAKSSVAVSLRMLERIEDLAGLARDPEHRRALHAHAQRVHAGALSSATDPHDRRALDERFARLDGGRDT